MSWLDFPDGKFLIIDYEVKVVCEIGKRKLWLAAIIFYPGSLSIFLPTLSL